MDACTENGDITDAFGDMLFLGGNDQIAKVGLKSCLNTTKKYILTN